MRPPSPPPATRGRPARAVRRAGWAAAVVLLALLASCGGASTDPLVRLAGAVPADVVAAADDGLLLRRGAAGAAVLAEQLGLDPAAIEATAEVGVPALRVVLADPAGVSDHLLAAGYAAQDRPGGDGWAVLVRPPDLAGFAGVPAVAVGEDLLAVGDAAQLDGLIAGGDGVPAADAHLAAADVARLVGPPEGAEGPVPLGAVVTSGPGQAGSVVLQLGGPGDQDDAVDLSVRLRTAPPLDEAGQPLLEVGAALTRDDRVVVDVTWLAEPAVLAAGDAHARVAEAVRR